MIAATTAFKAVHGPYVVLLVVTVAVWAMSELRQVAKPRPEATKIVWKDEIVLRVAVFAGVAVAVLALLHAPAATIHPPLLAAWLGLMFLWCGVGKARACDLVLFSQSPGVRSGAYRLPPRS